MWRAKSRRPESAISHGKARSDSYLGDLPSGMVVFEEYDAYVGGPLSREHEKEHTHSELKLFAHVY